MRLVPWAYPLRSLAVRWSSALFSALGIAMVVAVLCGVFALHNGFATLFVATGSDDVIVFLRPGATSEGESGFPFDRTQKIKKEVSAIALDDLGRPLAAAESYLALFLDRADGQGQVNAPIRGVEEASFLLHGDRLKIVQGRKFHFGSNEIIVGGPLSRRLKNCTVGSKLLVNTTEFDVVGIFEYDGAYRSELWGDVVNIQQALDRDILQRVVARIKPGTDVAALAKVIENDPQYGSEVKTERGYFESQTVALGDTLVFLGVFLTAVLGAAAVLGATNTMLASIGARTREVGILRAIGFREGSVLIAFLIEAALIGLVGGLLGCLIVLPLNGLETGTMNWNSFTDTSFAFRVDAPLLAIAVGIAMLLGILGGLVPAWRASRLPPVEALRRL
jgi:ABC-type antimicrobial peptide transport system permease subunit